MLPVRVLLPAAWRVCEANCSFRPPSLHVPPDGKQPQADGTFFQRRELCFTLDGDIFVRYQAFKVSARAQ